MAATLVIGSLWGDEAKGKIADVLGAEHDAVVRFSGGSNAGHTVKVSQKTYKLHNLPTGVLREDKVSYLGSSVFIDPESFQKELGQLPCLKGRLKVSPLSHVVTSYHKWLDRFEEQSLRETPLGTTLQGVGPAAADKMRRFGIRVKDLFHPESLKKKLRALVSSNPLYVESGIPLSECLEALADFAKVLEPYVSDVEKDIARLMSQHGKVLLEGAQGGLLDIDSVDYPYVTSSYCGVGASFLGTGLLPADLKRVVLVVKSYSTRVGSGPMNSEVFGGVATHIRDAGNEYGTTTGRPRRIGWLDLERVKKVARENGATEMALTLLDVLSGLETVGLVDSEGALRKLPGWEADLSGLNSFDQLPVAARTFVTTVEKEVGCPISLLSVGPEREQVILRKSP